MSGRIISDILLRSRPSPLAPLPKGEGNKALPPIQASAAGLGGLVC